VIPNGCQLFLADFSLRQQMKTSGDTAEKGPTHYYLGFSLKGLSHQFKFG
jgi:hypothetical protein